MPGDVKSQAQAAFLGSVIAGKNRKKGPTPEEARRMLKGANVKKLPKKKGKKKAGKGPPTRMQKKMARNVAQAKSYSEGGY